MQARCPIISLYNIISMIIYKYMYNNVVMHYNNDMHGLIIKDLVYNYLISMTDY